MITVKHIKNLDGLKDLIFEQTYNESIDRMSHPSCHIECGSVRDMD